VKGFRGPSPAPTLAESLREYGRGLAGGLLVSLPLLYTMEVWWAGFNTTPGKLLGYLGCVFLLLLGYNRYAGIRPDGSWTEVAIDSVEELGLGIITSAGILYLLGRLDAGQSSGEMLGRIVIEAGVVAIGFSVGTAQLGSGDQERNDVGDDNDDPASLGSDIVIGICGAVLFASNVAPTEEIQVIAMETSPARLLALAAVSIGLATLVLYFSDFTSTTRLARVESSLDVVFGAALTYAIAILSSAAILWFFGRFDGDSATMCVRQTIVLAFPAVLGASAGRMLIHR
jgi:putative integral membrane protein (TIGR02587 family)